jgi:hypothetical protein
MPHRPEATMPFAPAAVLGAYALTRLSFPPSAAAPAPAVSRRHIAHPRPPFDSDRPQERPGESPPSTIHHVP